MKINGTVVFTANKGGRFEFPVYRVTLKGGPMDKHQTLFGNCTGNPVLEMNGHRYELNADGDLVYSPAGQN